MVSLSHDSELMMQHVAAVAVPDSSRFVTVNNHDGTPMVFSLGNDGKFYLIINNIQGQRVILDFGFERLKLEHDYKAYAFDVIQDVDSTLYIILATSKDEESGSDLIVLRPFKPEEYDMAESTIDMGHLKMNQSGTPTKTIVKSIYIDVARLVTDASTKTWSIEYDLSLPENAFKMVALQPVNLPLKFDGPLPGFVAIYEIQDELQLVFVATKKMNSTYTKAALKCPPGACTLSSFINSDGYTDLLVGGKGLYHFSSKEILRKDSGGRQVSKSGVFSSIRQIHVTQDTEGISVWAANNNDGIGYLTARPGMEAPSTPVQVIPDSQGGRFSPFRSKGSHPEQFIVSDKDGHLTLLQYDSVQHLWDNVPFFTPALSTTIDFQAYTTQITLMDADSLPLTNTNVLLKSSGVIRIIANGVSVITGPDQTIPARTDKSGHITLIIPTTGISSYLFKVIGAPGGELEGKSWVVDPAVKVNKVLDSIHDASDLMNATLHSGERLLDGTDLTHDEIHQVAKAIEAIQNTRKDALDRNHFEGESDCEGPIQSSASKASSKSMVPTTGIVAGLAKGESPAQRSLSTTAGIFQDMLWEAWYWFESMATKVLSWSIHILDKCATFIVEIGGKTYRWILDGLTQIGKALSWLFHKVLGLGKKLLEWLGFLFDWEDIKATKNSIVYLTNSAIDCGVGYIGQLEDKVDGFFKEIITKLEESAGKERPEEISSVTAKSDSEKEKPNEIVTSAKANWSQYQFVHGGGEKGSVIHGEGKKASSLEQLWSETLAPMGKTLQGLVEDLANLIGQIFFNSDKSISVDEVMRHITGDILVKFVDGIRKVAVGIVGVMKTLVEEFKDLINAKITIPVFSSLYKQFISGNDLSVLDGISLILAIPITVIHKLVTGRAPPNMTGLPYDKIVNGTLKDEQQLLDFNHFSNVTGLVTGGLVGMLSTASVFASPGGLDTSSIATPRALSAPSLSNSMSASLNSSMSASSLSDSMSASGVTSTDASIDSPGSRIKGKFTEILGVIAHAASIPGSRLPAYTLRWISFVLSCVNTVVNMVVKRVTSASRIVMKKVLAAIQGALAVINYGLVVAIKVIEFQTSSFPGKSNVYQALALTSSTCDLLSTLSDDLGIIAVEPGTKAWTVTASTVARVLSYSIKGGVFCVKLSDGEYNEMISNIL